MDLSVFNVLLLGLDLQREHTFHVLGANSVACADTRIEVNCTLNSRVTFGVRPTRRSMVADLVFTGFGLLFYNINLLWIRGLLDSAPRSRSTPRRFPAQTW